MVISQLFDKIYLINMKHMPQRLEECKEEFKKIDLSYSDVHRVEGVKIGEGKTERERVLGCLKSHIKCIKHAKKNKYKKILILEDDVVFKDNFNSNLEDIDEFLKNNEWEFFYFGGSFHFRNETKYEKKTIIERTKYPNILQRNNILRTHCYALYHTIFDSIIKETEEHKNDDKPHNNIDWIFINTLQNTNCFVVHPQIAIQRPSFSFILNKEVDHETEEHEKNVMVALDYKNKVWPIPLTSDKELEILGLLEKDKTKYSDKSFDIPETNLILTYNNLLKQYKATTKEFKKQRIEKQLKEIKEKLGMDEIPIIRPKAQVVRLIDTKSRVLHYSERGFKIFHSPLSTTEWSYDMRLTSDTPRFDSFKFKETSNIPGKSLGVIIPYRDKINNLQNICKYISLIKKEVRKKINFYLINLGEDSKEIEPLCQQYEIIHHYIDYKKVFSIGLALNTGVSISNDDYIMKLDIDCVFETEFFDKIINSLDKDFFVVPLLYMNAETSEKILKKDKITIEDVKGISTTDIQKWNQRRKGQGSCFVIKRNFYKDIGGIDTRFKGHGYEDWQFLYFVLCKTTPFSVLTQKDNIHEFMENMLEHMHKFAKSENIILLHCNHSFEKSYKGAKSRTKNQKIFSECISYINMYKSKLKKVVICGQARSGTTLLKDLIGRHSEVNCCSFEPFNYDTKNGKKVSESMQKNSEFYLNHIMYYLTRSKTKVLGLKLLGIQGKAVWMPLNSDKKVSYIHINRSNLLEKFISWKIAKRDNVWLETETSEKKPIIVDYSECFDFFKKEKEAVSIIGLERMGDITIRDTILQKNMLFIEYEALVENQNEIMKKVFSFLGITFEPVKTNLKKQNTKRMDEIIENYAELKEQFKETEYAKFF